MNVHAAVFCYRKQTFYRILMEGQRGSEEEYGILNRV